MASVMMNSVWSSVLLSAYQTVEFVGLVATLIDVVSCELVSWYCLYLRYLRFSGCSTVSFGKLSTNWLM